jgi:hypothetical protein
MVPRRAVDFDLTATRWRNLLAPKQPPGSLTVARPPRGPNVYQAPRCPTDRLAPRRLTFTRNPGIRKNDG